MAQHRPTPQESKPKHSPGGLVGNYQDSEREETGAQEGSCERAPGGLVGNHQQGQPDCDQTGPGRKVENRTVETGENPVGAHRPPGDGELSPHEEPSDKAKAAAAARR